MNFLESIAVELTAAAVIASVVALWKTRDRIARRVRHVRSSLKQRREPEELSRDELLARVRRRAKVLGVDVPVKRQRRGDIVTTTYHPSGNTHDVFTGDFALYEAAVMSHRINPLITGPNGRPTPILLNWPDEKLQAWLAEHAHRTPSTP